MNVQEKKPRTMPKGGRKGGSVFPRISFEDAVAYARKLVSKTHVSAQPADVIFSGVVGAKSGQGRVRVSALKQYGFLTGDTKANYSADELAKKIASAPNDELVTLYREAVLKPTVFRKLFETFQGDEVTKAKLKQRAADLLVHPDERERCIELYVSGMVAAELATLDGDRVNHAASTGISTTPISSATEPISGVSEEDAKSEATSADLSTVSPETSPDDLNGTTGRTGPRAVFNINVALDSSMDIEKLQKQLELLKRFGAI